MAKKAATTSAFDVQIDPAQIELAAVCALVGDDGYLRHEARRALVARATDGDAAAAEILDGSAAELRDVLDALNERSLFGDSRRVVVVTDADPLVKQYRSQLEQYVERPAPDSVLVLEVAAWPATTRLAKAVAESGLTVRCDAPASGREATEYQRRLKEWLIAAARRALSCRLDRSGAEQLLEFLPAEPGLLYQEVARLALLVDAGAAIDGALVREHVGNWRTRETWDMIDAAADGRAADALDQLDKLLAAGEDPHGLLPQLASTLRRFGMAVRLIEQAERRRQRLSLRDALQQAGVPPFKIGDAERQLRQIGRHRARRIYRWLLAADLELKGHNSARDRARRTLEMLVMRLAREAAGAVAADGR